MSGTTRPRIVIAGGSFAGLTAAYELKRLLGDQARITVVDKNVVPGLGPEHGYTVSICNGPHALQARAAWEKFLSQPGPVIIGATQGSSCYGAAYEFVFNLE
ncbi:MAG: tryptophan 7-halogenase [Verrucomicrobiae bacterium]|nr:tryptophan 7-halogenase [Verrucomicrobiae bacterium]